MKRGGGEKNRECERERMKESDVQSQTDSKCPFETFPGGIQSFCEEKEKLKSIRGRNKTVCEYHGRGKISFFRRAQLLSEQNI
jgi:hypothetical protein